MGWPVPGNADQPLDGALAINPAAATAGTFLPFTLTFTTAVPVKDGSVILQVPAGWPAPQTETPGSDGYATSREGTLTTDPSTMTIQIAGLILATNSSIAVRYSATVPPPTAAGDTFTAAVQQTLGSAPVNAGSVSVTVTAPTPTPTPTATPTVTPTPTPTATATPSPTPTPASSSLWTWPGILLPLGLGLAVVLAVGLLVGWFTRHRPPPVITQSVRAVPHAGPPDQLNVHQTGTGATHTVRIEPHPGTPSTTIEERGP
jgi:hypothetical protein